MHDVTLITQLPTTPYQLAIPFEDKDSIAKHGLTISELHLALFKAEPKAGSVARIPTGDVVAILIGGKNTVRDFVASAVRAASGAAPLVIDLRGQSDAALSAAEAAMLSIKTPTTYKSESKSEIVNVQLLVDSEVSLTDAASVATEVIRAREIINMPANDLYPQEVAERAKSFAQGLPVTVEVWDENKLEQERCGGILGVGRGSVRPPRLVKIEYRGGGKHLGLAGKGITFDTGGLSLKPAEGMVGMKYDMAGAATVLAATLAIAKLGLKVNVTTVLCLAENMPSGSATRPGDVVKIRNGKTVEVLNTDAEGRLVLADGLSLLTEMKPDHIVDVATLTGAASIALGKRHTGLMGFGAVIEEVQSAANAVGELVWHMPLAEELKETLQSELADMTNVKIGNRAGGMLVGGLFLQEFVDKESSWAHLDIASAANNDGAPYSVYPSGATGVMIRTLVQLARNLETAK
jgi:leucyl aminopeptidase